MTEPSARPRLDGLWLAAALAVLYFAGTGRAFAHGVSGGDAAFLATATGWQLWPYFYLGAKHMVTGYDHLLFLVGVIFYLYRFKDIAIYVTLFSVGHSLTLLFGVLSGTNISAYLVDAVIGLSVTYKAIDNLGGFKTLFGRTPNPKLAVFGFGLIHGFGLSTKLQDISLSPDGLIPNMIAFNVGVEVGQILALLVILIVMNWWRSTRLFERQAVAANVVLMMLGFLLFFYQIAGYFWEMGL